MSTAEQADSGLGLAAQRSAIEAEAGRRDWTVLAIHEDAGMTGKSTKGREGLAAAVAAVEGGAAGAIVVAKLDWLSRSLADLAQLMARAQAGRWNLVALDLGIDLATAASEFMANVMASAAQWERRIIGQRTKDARAIRRAQGARLGHPPLLPANVVVRIFEARRSGAGWSALARDLDADGVPTAQGGARWYPARVRAVYFANDTGAA